jgi:hypothetical protein
MPETAPPPVVDARTPAPDLDPVAASIDGAIGDWSVSGDAMRWSPALAERGAEEMDPAGALAGVDMSTGLGTVLGFETGGVRRLVSEALSSLGAAATDVVQELRQLTRGAADDPDR